MWWVKFSSFLGPEKRITHALPFEEAFPWGDLEWLSKKYILSTSFINPKQKTPVTINAFLLLDKLKSTILCSISFKFFEILGLNTQEVAKNIWLTSITPTTSSTLK